MSATLTDADPAIPAPEFAVRLDNFEGPFDLLLGLIAKHRLDITEVALSQVTDEFIAWVRAADPDRGLDDTSGFLVVAATLLDLKAARLLPRGEVDDEEDLARLEARDLLFARLLQYRAYKQVAGTLAQAMAREAARVPRAVGPEERFTARLPEVRLELTPAQLAALAARAVTPRPRPVLHLEHLHAPAVSVREQAALMVEHLRGVRSATFRALVADAPGPATTVARFLALLQLFREGAVWFEQVAAMGELHVRWSGPDDARVEVEEEFDPTPESASR